MNNVRIFCTCFILLVAVPSLAYAGNADTLILSVQKTTVTVGEEIDVTVFASTTDQAMNAVSGSIVFPANMSLARIGKAGSIVNFWTRDPQPIGNRVEFEGVILNPGYQGARGKLFTITFVAQKAGKLPFYFKDGAILANDGLGTNILDTLGMTTVAVKEWAGGPLPTDDTLVGTPVIASSTPVILPVITEYSPVTATNATLSLKGKGQPGALTKIVFKNTALKSIGEKFLDFVQTKKNKLDDVLVKNEASGSFEYTSGSNLIAGAYNATPFLVDTATNTERPGFGVQFLVNDSKMVHVLVIAINVLGLLVPIVGLVMLIYFIPWYSVRRMHLLKRRLGLEEEKIQLTEHTLKNKESALDNPRP